MEKIFNAMTKVQKIYIFWPETTCDLQRYFSENLHNSQSVHEGLSHYRGGLPLVLRQSNLTPWRVSSATW